MSANGSSSAMMSEFLHNLCSDYKIHNSLTEEARANSNIKRGLRNDDGTGTLARYPKKSFYWYKDVIASNGAVLKA